MQRIVELSRDPRVEGRIVFLENYDIGLARTIVPGCDVWLNTPRRPLEASGTSGMKAAVNGVLNLSVLDGWWAEGYSPEVGWAIDGVSDEADVQPALPAARARRRPDVPRPARPLDRDDEGVDRRAGAAFLDAAGRDRLRRGLLPARARIRPPLSG